MIDPLVNELFPILDPVISSKYFCVDGDSVSYEIPIFVKNSLSVNYEYDTGNNAQNAFIQSITSIDSSGKNVQLLVNFSGDRGKFFGATGTFKEMKPTICSQGAVHLSNEIFIAGETVEFDNNDDNNTINLLNTTYT